MPIIVLKMRIQILLILSFYVIVLTWRKFSNSKATPLLLKNCLEVSLSVDCADSNKAPPYWVEPTQRSAVSSRY